MARRSRRRKSNNRRDKSLGKLFYATILTNKECNFGRVGLNKQIVHSINYKDVGALVSDYPRVDKIKLLRKNLAPYHQVVRDAAKRFTTIPARFGQIARDEAEVNVALRKNYDEIRQELERLDGKVEMGVKVRWNVEDLFEYFLRVDEELKARREKLQNKKNISRTEQVDFGRFFHNRIESARADITERIITPLPPAELRLDDVSEDNIIANISLLISESLLQELEDAVDELGDSIGEEYSLKIDGPWPPFSFVESLELHLSH